MADKQERHFPRWAARLVGLFALGLVVFLVSLALRSSRHAATDIDVSNPSTVASLASASGSSGDFLTCLDCHGDPDKVLTDGSPVDQLLNFTHKVHFSKGVSACENCHPLPAHEPDKINKPTMGRCFVCHGTGKTAIAPGTCNTCHPPGSPTIPSTHTQGNWLKDHPTFAQADPFECASCHQESFCQACHGLPTMPHPDGWKGDLHIQTFFKVGIAVCQNCHQVGATPQESLASSGRDFCDQCHHQWGPKGTPWIKYHPQVVKSGDAQTCFECHNPITCATCHVDGQENLNADRRNFNVPEAPPVVSPSASTSPSVTPTPKQSG